TSPVRAAAESRAARLKANWRKTDWASSADAGRSGLMAVTLFPFAKQTVDLRDLRHEGVEALVGGGQLAHAPDQQRARPAGPKEQRQMGQVPPFGNRFRQFIHDL